MDDKRGAYYDPPPQKSIIHNPQKQKNNMKGTKKNVKKLL